MRDSEMIRCDELLHNEELRHEFAALIRQNVEEIASRLEHDYVITFPHSSANQLDVSETHKWTLDELETFARVVETGEYGAITYRGYIGDCMVDPHESSLTMFASFVSSILFEARTIAPVVFRAYSMGHDSAHTSELIDVFESCVQSILSINCQRYVEEMTAPGNLRRSWNLAAGVFSSSAPSETPLQKFSSHDDAQDIDARLGDIAFAGEEYLSDREKEVLRCILGGKSNGEIAEMLGIRQNTVKNHVSRIFDKCNVNSRAELIIHVLGKRK